MISKKQVAAFVSTVKEKHVKVLEKTNRVIESAFRDYSIESRQLTAEDALAAVNGLLDVLGSGSVPGWLVHLKKHLERVSKEPNVSTGVEALKTIATKDLPNAESHSWDFSEDSGVDFDQVFAEARDRNNIPELFDNTVKLLESLVATGEIDRVSLLNRLEKLIATLKKSRQGSFVSVKGAWALMVALVVNSLWEYASDFEKSGPIFRALRTVIDSGTVQIDRAEVESMQAISKEMGLEPICLDTKPHVKPSRIESIPPDSSN